MARKSVDVVTLTYNVESLDDACSILENFFTDDIFNANRDVVFTCKGGKCVDDEYLTDFLKEILTLGNSLAKKLRNNFQEDFDNNTIPFEMNITLYGYDSTLSVGCELHVLTPYENEDEIYHWNRLECECKAHWEVNNNGWPVNLYINKNIELVINNGTTKSYHDVKLEYRQKPHNVRIPDFIPHHHKGGAIRIIHGNFDESSS